MYNLYLPLILIIILTWSTQGRWRGLFKALPWIVILSDIPRKYTGISAFEYLYLLKDVLVIAIYFGVLCSSGALTQLRTLLSTPFYRIVWVSFLALLPLYAIAAIVPGQDFLLTLGGFRNYLLYMPLGLLIPLVFPWRDGVEPLITYLNSLARSIPPMFVLVMIQYSLPTSHWLNQTYQEANLTHGDVVRATGSFSYITGLTTYVVFMLPLALFLFHLNSSRQNALNIVLVLLISAATGSRMPVAVNLIVLIYYLTIIAARYPRLLSRVTMMIFGIGLPLVIALFALDKVDVVFAPVFTLADRIYTTSDTQDRLLYTYLYQIRDFANNVDILWGYGPGSLNTFVSTIAERLSIPIQELDFSYGFDGSSRIEAEPGRILLEMGVLFFLAFYGIRIGLSLIGFRVRSVMRDTLFLEVLCRVQAMAALLSTIFIPLVNNHFNFYFYWFQIGLIAYGAVSMRFFESLALPSGHHSKQALAIR